MFKGTPDKQYILVYELNGEQYEEYYSSFLDLSMKASNLPENATKIRHIEIKEEK